MSNKQMLLDIDSEVWMSGEHLYVSIDVPVSFLGSMMVVRLEISGVRYKTKVFGLQGSVAVQIPEAAAQRLKISPGHRLVASVSMRPFKQDMRIPPDLAAQLRTFGLDLSVMPPSERRQALLYVTEATSPEVRARRINALVDACRRKSELLRSR